MKLSIQNILASKRVVLKNETKNCGYIETVGNY